MTTAEDLTKRLTSNLRPVRPMSLGREFALWIILAVITAIGLLVWVGVRPDLALKMRTLNFDIAFMLFVGAFLAASFLSLRSAIPGRAFLRKIGGAQNTRYPEQSQTSRRR